MLHSGSKKQMKKLKKILKNEDLKPLSLKEACSKFNEAVGIDDRDDSKVFLERLWDLKKKIKVLY